MTYVAHCLLALAFLVPAGCGECHFDFQVEGSVLDENGKPLAGVEVSVCNGDRCEVDESDDLCISVVTDADGRFSLEALGCRPKAFECELRPMLLNREGCDQAIARVDSYGKAGVMPDEFVYACSQD